MSETKHKLATNGWTVRTLLPLLLLSGCVTWTPFVEVEHVRSHRVDFEIGVAWKQASGAWEIYWSPSVGVVDYPQNKAWFDYTPGVGIRWRLR